MGESVIYTLLGQATLLEKLSRVLRVSEIYIEDNILPPTVCLLRQTLVLVAVSRFHVENRNMEALGRYL